MSDLSIQLRRTALSFYPHRFYEVENLLPPSQPASPTKPPSPVPSTMTSLLRMTAVRCSGAALQRRRGVLRTRFTGCTVRLPTPFISSAQPFSSSATPQKPSSSSVSPSWLDSVDWIDRTGTAPSSSEGLYKIFTDNAFVTPPSPPGSTPLPLLPVTNPATQQRLGQVLDEPHNSSDKDSSCSCNALVSKAVNAFDAWQSVPVQQRQRVFFDLQRLIRDHRDELAQLITIENGKTLPDAHGDVQRGLEVVETACNVAPHLLGDSLMHVGRNMDCISYRVPLGVCVGLAPFNFPAMIPLWMFPLSIACGNVCLLKPSEKAPSASLRLAQLAAEAGLPPNVLQVVPGGRNWVEALCDHPDIKALSFVGSNVAGEAVFDRGTRNGKRVQSNLGAKNHAVILPDADKDATIRALAGAAFGAAGQRCMALSVAIFVGETRHWVSDLCQHAATLRVGPGWESTTDIGPLVTPDAKRRVEDILQRATGGGNGDSAELHLDGRGVVVPGIETGNFVGPTVLHLSGTDNPAYNEEIFGPVLVVLEADTLDDALRIVNANPYGNGCALFTKSGAAARHFTTTVEAGQIGINTPIPVPLPMFSFTGNKASLRGDAYFYGPSGVQFFTQLKTVTSHWPPPPSPSTSTQVVDLGGVTMPTMEHKHHQAPESKPSKP